jgi:hypothetical protein
MRHVRHLGQHGVVETLQKTDVLCVTISPGVIARIKKGWLGPRALDRNEEDRQRPVLCKRLENVRFRGLVTPGATEIVPR